MHKAMRALSVSLILILSSLAGCLADDEIVTSDIELDDENYGTVMVSTYHVGQLVSAVAGDSITIEYMSQDNIPVHDYEPSASDLIRLQQADIFFYHGLNLEPWVESTLSSLGDDAPPSYMTHAMPTGESALDYESMLVSNLCELMIDGPFESTTLGMISEDEHDDHDDEMTPELLLELFDSNNDSYLSWDELWDGWNSNDDDHDDDHDDHSDEGDDHDDDDGEIHADEDEEVFMYDPHSWLSPLAFEAQLAVVLDSLVLNFPNGTNIFNTNAVAYSAQLQALDNGFNDAFGDSGDCDTAGVTKTIIANHNAYSYMTLKYDIEVVSLHGLDPEGEPSPEDIAEVVDHINEEGITVLFVEEFTDQGAVDSIVQQTGVSIQILYTMELSPSDANDNYLSLMNKNLESLISGIGC